MTSESSRNSWSLFHVPGLAFIDTERVPHGAVAAVTYWSETLGRHRRMHVYTPPGYENSRDRYPVFYFLHGAGDSDNSWSTVGRAGFIIDNLIAAGAAVPMIVVMPDGHPPTAGSGPGGMQIEGFAREFAADIKPQVEARYRALTGRGDTAIAGLSMGGAHTLEIAIGDEDFPLDTAKASVAMFREHGFDVVYHESGGGHTWMNWRDYLHEFAQAIFE